MKFRYSEKDIKFDPSATYNLTLLDKKEWKMGHPDFSRIESAAGRLLANPDF